MERNTANPAQSPIKAALGQHILTSDPRIMAPIPNNQLHTYSTVHPVAIQSAPYSHYSQTQTFIPGRPHVIRSRVLEPTRVPFPIAQQVSTVQPFYAQQSVAVERPPMITRINYHPLQQVNTQVEVSQVQKVEETQTVKPAEVKVVEEKPEIRTTVKYEYAEEPKVDVAKDSAWPHYYGQKVYATPPPPAPAAPQPKTCCNPILLGILGLLALAGLITGIILAAKAGGGSSISGSNSQTPGTPTNTTPFTPTPSPSTNTTNTTITTNTTVQPIYTNPTSVPPTVITTNATQVEVVSAQTVPTAPSENVSYPNSSITTTVTVINTTTTANTTATANTTIDRNPTISQPVFDVGTNPAAPAHKLKAIQYHKKEKGRNRLHRLRAHGQRV